MGDTNNKDNYLSKIEKAFNIFVVFLPILQYYKSPLPVFNLATFLAIVFLVVLPLSTKGVIKLNNRQSPVLIYVIFISFNLLLTSGIYKYDISTSMLDYLRTMLLIISILFIGVSYFNIHYAISIMEKLLIASACFMLVQLFSYYFLNMPITGNIPALVTNEGYKTATNRATGFYMEPAAYAQSAMIYLCFKLFRKEKLEKKDIIRVLLVMIGILLSGSGQGYFFLMLVVMMWLLYNFFFVEMTRNKAIKGVIIIVVIIIGIFVVVRTPYGQYVISRILPDESSTVFNSLGGSALSGRTYTNKLFYNLPQIQKIWGVGFGRAETVVGTYYINSLFFYLIECGYISIIIWGIMLLVVFTRGELWIKAFTLFYMIMFYFTGCAKPMMLCFYFMFLLMGNENIKRNCGIENRNVLR